jgi:hypothetical protein
MDMSKLWWVGLMVVLMLAGCGEAKGTQTPTDTATQEPTRTLTITPTIRLTPTRRREPTLTRTSTHWPTPTPTLTASPTPFPTLPDEQRISKILHLYNNNGGCDLPCWWGIVPGETSWETTISILAPLSEIRGPYIVQDITQYTLRFVLPEDIDPFGNLDIPGVEPGTFMGLYVENDIVKAIGVDSYFIKRGNDYSLSGLLIEFGKPEEIWAYASPWQACLSSGQKYWYCYRLELYYPHKGISIYLQGAGDKQQENIYACPQTHKTRRDNYPPGLTLWTPTTIYTYQEFHTEFIPGISEEDLKNYPFETLTDNFTIQDFYETYLNPNTKFCFGIDGSRISMP